MKTASFINEPQTEDVEHAMNTEVETVVCLAESAAIEIVTPMPIGNVKAVKGVTKPTMVDGLNISELPTNACCLTANSGEKGVLAKVPRATVWNSELGNSELQNSEPENSEPENSVRPQ